MILAFIDFSEAWDDLIQFITNLWEIVQFAWNFFEYCLRHFGLSFLVAIAIDLIGLIGSLVSESVGFLGFTSLETALDDAAATMDSQNVENLYTIAGWLLDFVVDVHVVDQALGFVLVFWVMSVIIGHVMHIYHQVWGSS